MDLTVQSDHRGQRVPSTLDSLLREATLDAELAALLSLLVEARVPLVVAGHVEPPVRAGVLEALLEPLPEDVRRIRLAGATEDFAWLPEAESLGWRADGPTPGRDPLEPATPDATMLVAGDLTTAAGGAPWAGVVRIAVRAISLGYGFAATIDGGSLEEVFETLRASPFRVTDDELSRLGAVVILAPSGRVAPTIVAAHYVRPVARDMHGHVQRLGPAVLATGDPASGRFEHFGWGVTPELALRTGRRAGDFEIELDRRRDAFGARVGGDPPADPRPAVGGTP